MTAGFLESQRGLGLSLCKSAEASASSGSLPRCLETFQADFWGWEFFFFFFLGGFSGFWAFLGLWRGPQKGVLGGFRPQSGGGLGSCTVGFLVLKKTCRLWVSGANHVWRCLNTYPSWLGLSCLGMTAYWSSLFKRLSKARSSTALNEVPRCHSLWPFASKTYQSTWTTKTNKQNYKQNTLETTT